MEQAVTEGSPIVVCTYPANERRSEKQGLVPDHAYTLLGTRRDGDECFVRLRNPWGALEPRGDAKDDGIFEIPLEKFTHYFCWASICPSA